jgi:hypothetical protein
MNKIIRPFIQTLHKNIKENTYKGKILYVYLDEKKHENIVKYIQSCRDELGIDNSGGLIVNGGNIYASEETLIYNPIRNHYIFCGKTNNINYYIYEHYRDDVFYYIKALKNIVDGIIPSNIFYESIEIEKICVVVFSLSLPRYYAIDSDDMVVKTVDENYELVDYK